MADFELARWLTAWLDREGISAAELGRRSDLSRYQVARMANGGRHGEWDTLTKLARGLGMTRAQLVAAVDSQPLPPYDEGERTTTAIRHDPNLSDDQIDLMLAQYRHFRRPRRGP